ncbi:MAG: DMT family transporter, partial [Hyphomicrobiaceae bacterium]
PLVAYELATVGGFSAVAEELGVLAYYAVFPSLLAYIFWNRAVKNLGPGRTAMFMHLMPIFSALLAVIVLGEVLRPYHFAGLVLIIGGITLVTKPPNPGRAQIDAGKN